MWQDIIPMPDSVTCLFLVSGCDRQTGHTVYGISNSPTRRWFYQWKWQCSKSWSHSQNSLCSPISIRRGCACGMLGWRLFTTVYYYINGKTRRVHSRDVFYWAWITRTWRDAWTIYVTHVIDTRSIRARMQSRRRCVVLWLGKYWISRGRNVLLQGNSWRLRFDGLSLRFWQKTNSFATLTRVFFSQTSTRVHQILIPTHNHEVTPYCYCHYYRVRGYFMVMSGD